MPYGMPFRLPLGMPLRLPFGLRFRRRPLRKTGLEWAEGFWKGIRPFVHLRVEDALLILPPSRVFKLNSSGCQVLDFLSRGGSLADIPGLDDKKIEELH